MLRAMDHRSNRSHRIAWIKSVPVRPIRQIRGLFAFAFVIVVMTSSLRAQEIVDQILTLVNDEVVTRTDLLWSIAMDSKAPSPAGPVGPDLLRQKLDVMIDERLISQEAGRIPATDITQDEVDKKRAELIKGFRSEAEFRQRVGSVGLTPQRIDELIRQRIVIDRFVDSDFALSFW